MDAAVRELTDYDIVEPAPPDAPVTGSVYLRPVTATKTVLIFDLRPHSLAQDHDPVRFSLPLPAHLQPHILASPHAHLTRIDVSRYYDSLRLPPTAASFVFAYDGRKFRYRRLPFGWDRAPAVAQRLMLSLVRTAVDSVRTTHRVTALVYLDDVVVLCDDPRECDEVTRAITEHMTAAGLLPNREKSVLVPTPSLTALGRTISVPDATIRPTEGTVAAAVKAALRVATAPTSRKTKLAAAGLLLWTSRRVLPFLQRLFGAAHATRHTPRPTRALTRDLIRAAAFAARDVWRADKWAITDSPITLAHSDRTPYFVDASADRRLAAVVSPGGFTRVWRVPQFLLARYPDRQRAQQAAELFAVTKATRLALARRAPALIIPDSTSALYATYALSSGAFAVHRAQLLARTAAAASKYHHHDIMFAYYPTELHPADPLTYSRPSAQRDALLRLAAAHVVRPPPPADPTHGYDHRSRSDAPAFGGVVARGF